MDAADRFRFGDEGDRPLDADFLQHIESDDMPCRSCGARWVTYKTVPSPATGLPTALKEIEHHENCLYIALQED